MRVLGAVRKDDAVDPLSEGVLGAGGAEGGLKAATAGGINVLVERAVPSGVSNRLAVAVVVETVSRRAVGVDPVVYLALPVAVTSVAVS